MEVAWEDRGAIGMCALRESVGRGNWDDLTPLERSWWNRVYDACISSQKIMVVGGTQILVTGDNNNG